MCHIKHVCRTSNTDANALAKHTLSDNEMFVWVEDISDIIRDIIVTTFSVNEISPI